MADNGEIAGASDSANNTLSRGVSFRSPLTSPLGEGEGGEAVGAGGTSANSPMTESIVSPLGRGARSGSGGETYSRGQLATPNVVTAETPTPLGRKDAPIDTNFTPPIVGMFVDTPGGKVGTESGLKSSEVAKMIHEERMVKAMYKGSTMSQIENRSNAKEVVPLGAEKDMGVEMYEDVRHTRKMNYYIQGAVLLLVFTAQGLFIWGQIELIQEDGLWLRWLNVAWVPVYIFFMLFAVQFAINQVICSLGPIAHMQTNSQFFSAIAPPRPLHYPKMTIQMPVYKEGLEGTIIPTLQSLEVAITHYRKAGGECRIFINDDGLQLISEEDRKARIATYEEHKIGYVARPDPSVRARAGLFKKASNMNYALNISIEVQEKMEEGLKLQAAQAAVREKWNNEFLIGGDTNMGEIILLIDSDTRVPYDCLTKVVGEFELTKDLGFLQCRTTPLRDQDNYWEDMIAHFTESIYDVGISLAVSAGDPAPLVGHNAFLRWECVKQASWVDKKDGERKFWSESHVSEDFDMSLRLQTLGYIGRYCTYTGSGFQEGVSLTAADEVIRLRKYAFGACEMVLNRFKDWPCKGPLTRMYIDYLTSPSVPWPAKFAMSGYLGTYLAMAYAIIGVSAYVVMRMFVPAMQQKMTNTFDIYMTTLVLFGAIGCLGSGTIRYRMGYSSCRSIFGAWWMEIRNAPVVTIFFASTLWHLTTSCWNYFWDIPMVWGATIKEVENTTFLHEFKTTFLRYRTMFFVMIAYGALFCFGMWYKDMPWEDIRLTFPVMNYIIFHIFGPFLLNPTLMRGHY